jgi:hypothetical protein
MSSPSYDGKRQPAEAAGWFSGLAAWWNGLTPQYVTAGARPRGAASRNGASSTGAPDKSPDSSSKPAGTGTDISTAPSAAK